MSFRVTEKDVLAEMAGLYQDAVSAAFTAIFAALEQAPEDLTARDAAKHLKSRQPAMEAEMAAEFKRALGEGSLL